MELLSIVPLASNSCPHRSLTSSAHKPQPFWRTMHTLRMTRKRKSVLPSMNMSLTTVVSGDGVQRRTDGNYQPVLWNDDIIQLLSTPYGVILFKFLPLHIPPLSFTSYSVIFSTTLHYLMDMVRNLRTATVLIDLLGK